MCVYVCVYICMCVCVYIYIYIYVCMYMFVYSCIIRNHTNFYKTLEVMLQNCITEVCGGVASVCGNNFLENLIYFSCLFGNSSCPRPIQ